MLMTLNHYVASAGVCSRRKAAELIKEQAVAINGTIVTDPGMRVPEDAVVTVNGMPLRQERKAYIILRKPAGYITTMQDEEGRPTVISLIRGIKERVVPVGRLDEHTTGILLLTNDGQLAQRLAHPRYGVMKEYQGILDQDLPYEQAQEIRDGIMLEDGFVKVESLIQPAKSSRRKFIIRLKSGRNRVIRRIFSHFDYNVVKLDRTKFATLSYKGLKEGEWRKLTREEITQLHETAMRSTEARPANNPSTKTRANRSTRSRQSDLKNRRGRVTSRRNP